MTAGKQRKVFDAVQKHGQRGGRTARVCTGEEKKISRNVIENNLDSVEYSVIITDRKNVKDSDVPEERYIGLATNHPAIKTELMPKYGGWDEVLQNRGVQDQDTDHRHGIQNAVLLLFPGIVQ